MPPPPHPMPCHGGYCHVGGKGSGENVPGKGTCPVQTNARHPSSGPLRSTLITRIELGTPSNKPGRRPSILPSPFIVETSSLHPQKGRTLGEFIANFLRGGTGLASLATPQAHLQVPAAGAGAEVRAGTGAGAEATDIPDTDTDPVVAVPSGPTRTGGLRSGLQRRGACGTHAECRTTKFRTPTQTPSLRCPRDPSGLADSEADFSVEVLAGPTRSAGQR